MDARPDISDKLVHFTSGDTAKAAFSTLKTILTQRQLVGGAAKIKGNYPCVCFTEAPLTSLQHGLINPSAYSRYSSFGIIIEKAWLFAKGGRPVIYQSDAEYAGLPEVIRWRHVRYEPDAIDFTWEREWRIKTDKLSFGPNEAGIVIPEGEWLDELVGEHSAAADLEVLQYSLVMDHALAEQFREGFPWRVYAHK